MAENTEKQVKTVKRRGGSWKPGQSGNPKGKPTDPAKLEAIGLLKTNSRAITQKALDLVLCDEPNIMVLNALIKKIFPDNLNLGGDPENPLIMLLQRIDGKGQPKPGA